LAKEKPNFFNEITNAYSYSEHLWKDFEKELPSCSVDISERGIQMGGEMRAEIDYDPYDDMGIGIWLKEQYEFIYNLPKILRAWIESIDINKAQKFKQTLFACDSKYFTFNYTATLERVYGIDADDILHIHGFVENKNEELVIGHGDKSIISEMCTKMTEAENDFLPYHYASYKQVHDYCSATFKQTASMIDRNSKYFNNLACIDNVIVIGHSLGQVDMPYFEKIRDSISPNAIWNVYYHDPNDESRFRSTIEGIGVLKENINVDSVTELYEEQVDAE